MPIIMPPPPAIIRPEVVEPYGTPELYADGGVIHIEADLTHTVLYRRYGGERHAVLRIIMLRQSLPEDGFEVSLIRAYLESNGGPRH